MIKKEQEVKSEGTRISILGKYERKKSTIYESSALGRLQYTCNDAL